MSIDFIWDNDDHTIIRLDFDGKATWGEYQTATDRVYEAIEASSTRVDIIFHAVSGMPQGNPLPHLKASSMKLLELEHFGIGVVVTSKGTPSRLIQTFLDIAMRIYRLDTSRQGGYFSTLDEARLAIAQARAEEVK